MKTLISLICVLTLVSFSGIAQDTTSNKKIDTILTYQKEMMQLQQKTYDEVRYDDPLANKKRGIEMNVARLLYSTSTDYFTLSGTFSLFDIDRHAELAFPFFYQSGTKKEKESFGNNEYSIPLTLLNLDAVYRYFLGKHQNGFYFSAGMRYTYIKGIEGIDVFIFNVAGGPEITVSKIGAHFGIGYRYFTASGFYWGTNLIFGRYFSNNSQDVKEVVLDDSKLILDFELLKFGIAF